MFDTILYVFIAYDQTHKSISDQLFSNTGSLYEVGQRHLEDIRKEANAPSAEVVFILEDEWACPNLHSFATNNLQTAANEITLATAKALASRGMNPTLAAQLAAKPVVIVTNERIGLLMWTLMSTEEIYSVYMSEMEVGKPKLPNFPPDPNLLKEFVEESDILRKRKETIHSKDIKRWDAFISHAHEDKENLVRPLAEYLESLGVNIWYDEMSLQVGDSLSRSIDQGLAYSKFGVVILSKAFLSKGWTEYELRGLIAKEINSKNVIILPVWLDIDQNYLLLFSPPLAEKKP